MVLVYRLLASGHKSANDADTLTLCAELLLGNYVNMILSLFDKEKYVNSLNKDIGLHVNIENMSLLSNCANNLEISLCQEPN